MRQEQYTTKSGKCITFSDRLRIETLYKEKLSPTEIGLRLPNPKSRRTIERELMRGMVEQLDYEARYYKTYSAVKARESHATACERKGRQLKLGNDHKLEAFIEHCILVEKLSPYATEQRIKQAGFATRLCFKTIYNYIDAEVFLNVTNKDLWEKHKRKKRKYEQVRPAYTNLRGKSVSERPKEAESRQDFGHWEMDTVESGKGDKTALLVFTERLTRYELVFKLASKTQSEVLRVLAMLERKLGAKGFRKRFKSITCDNGCEFLDWAGIERSIRSRRARTSVYFCHPYHAWERGSNENANRMIRRFIPKGAHIGNYTDEQLAAVQDYINNCPRRSLAGMPASDLFKDLT
jgi:IS30 family transposase